MPVYDFVNDAEEMDLDPLEPLFEPSEPEKPYPLTALPEIISQAVEEYRAYGQQPLALIASSANAAASLACQGLADVERDPRLVGPISLNFAMVAVSGERKTAADHQFIRGARKWEADQREALAADAGRARATIASWAAEREGLLNKMKSAAGRKATGEAADMQVFKDRLTGLEQNKPTDLILPKLFYEDANAETLAVCFAEDIRHPACGRTRAGSSSARTA
jgi:hypothetical protein